MTWHLPSVPKPWTVLPGMSAARPVFSLFLAHALDTHAHHLSRAKRKGEPYATRQDAVEHWQMPAGDAVTRPWHGLFSTWPTSVRQMKGVIPTARSFDLQSRPSTCSAKSYHWMHRASAKHFITSQLACWNWMSTARLPLTPESLFSNSVKHLPKIQMRA